MTFWKDLKVLRRTHRLLSLIWHGLRWKRRVQQFFYCCMCIRYRGNVSTDPLPSNDRRIFTEPLPSTDKETFTEPLPSNNRGEYTDTHAQTATWSHKPTLFFQNKESRLKSGSGLIEVISPRLSRVTEENPDTSQSGYTVSRARFEPSTSRIRDTSVTAM
jgi:hypothetical protein